MKLNYQGLLSLFFLSATNLHAAPFQKTVINEFTVGKDLASSCEAPILTSKICDLPSVIHSQVISIPLEYAGSPETTIEIQGTFKNAEGKYALRISGSSTPFTNEASQKFVIPAGISGDVTVEIVPIVGGRQVIRLPYKATIAKLIVNLDGTSYINKTLAALGDLRDRADKDRKYYAMQKKFLRWFSKTMPEIEEMKEEETGRLANDLTNNCKVDNEGKESPLDPEECSKLKVFNDILSGKDDSITAQEKAKAWSDFTASVVAYQKAVTDLTAVSIQVSEEIVKNLELALSVLKVETADQTPPQA